MALGAGDTHSSLHLTYEKANITLKTKTKKKTTQKTKTQHMRPVKYKEVK